MSTDIAIYPASFDPITNGHVDIAERAATIFGKLIVGVYSKPMKNLLFSAEERWQMTQEALAHIPNVTVKQYSNLTIQFAREHQARVIVRGLRVVSDFEWEFQLALTNRTLAPDIDTVSLMASQEYSFLSSSLLRDIALNKGSVNHLAPPNVVEALLKKVAELDGEGS
ncbi:MAG: pantetheine-phosphate adenylyltransferase [Anaerolineae bacterium]